MDSKQAKREKAREVVDILEEISELLVRDRKALKFFEEFTDASY